MGHTFVKILNLICNLEWQSNVPNIKWISVSRERERERECGKLIICDIFLSPKLIDYLQFHVPLKTFSLIWRRHHCQGRATKFRPMLGAQGLWAGRDLYRATPAVTRDLCFSGLIRRTAPFNRLLRHTWGCGGPILTRILTGIKSKSHNFRKNLWIKTKLECDLQLSMAKQCTKY
jgi:hypothetical protein